MDDIKSTIFNITKSVTKTSGDFLKTTKLSMNLSTAENDLKNLYLETGKKVHEIYMYGGTLGKFFDEKFLEIEACERKITELRDQINAVKGTKSCPKCGKSLDRAAEFCQKCGVRVELSASVMPPTVDVPMHESPSPKTTKHTFEEVPVAPTLDFGTAELVQKSLPKCKVCGSENEVGTKFCLSCGRLID